MTCNCERLRSCTLKCPTQLSFIYDPGRPSEINILWFQKQADTHLSTTKLSLRPAPSLCMPHPALVSSEHLAPDESTTFLFAWFLLSLHCMLSCMNRDPSSHSYTPRAQMTVCSIKTCQMTTTTQVIYFKVTQYTEDQVSTNKSVSRMQ